MENVENSSVEWREINQAEVITATTFICVFTVTGLFGNILLIGCLLKNRTERWKPAQLLLTNLCVINILDCVINMSFMISTTLAQSWTYTGQVCRIQAFTVQLVNSLTTLALISIALDRLVAVKESENYCDILTIKKIFCIIGYCWCQAMSLAIPVIADVIPSTFYATKYLCSVGSSTPLVYVIFLCSLCFIFPLFILIGLYIYILRVALIQKSKDKLEQRNLYSDMAIAFSTKTKELNLSKYTFFTSLVWLILCVPYLTMNFYELIRNSLEILESNEKLSVFTPPAGLDTIFTWARCSFPAVFAVTNLCRKDFRNSFKTLFMCRRNNSVIDLNSASKSKSLDRKVKPKLLLSVSGLQENQVTQRKDSPLTPGTFQVPVLFATANGIHLHKCDNELNITSKDVNQRKTSSESCSIPVECATKCDVLGSQSDLIQVEDDTSDYDSCNEVDRFSVSNPVSSKRPENVMPETDMHRSLSNPEFARIGDQAVSRYGTSYNDKPRGVMPCDSGIDISSSAGNSMNRNKNWSKKQTVLSTEMAGNVTDVSLPSAVNSLSGVMLSQISGSPTSNCPSSCSVQVDESQCNSPMKSGHIETSTSSDTCQNNSGKKLASDIQTPGMVSQNSEINYPIEKCSDACQCSDIQDEISQEKSVKNSAFPANSSAFNINNSSVTPLKPHRLEPIQYCVSPARRKNKTSKISARRNPEERAKNVDIYSLGDNLRNCHTPLNTDVFSSGSEDNHLINTLTRLEQNIKSEQIVQLEENTKQRSESSELPLSCLKPVRNSTRTKTRNRHKQCATNTNGLATSPASIERSKR